MPCLECQWEWVEAGPCMLAETRRLFAKWLNPRKAGQVPIPEYHPELIAIKEQFSMLRTRATDNLVSVARLPLKFQVQQRIDEIHRVGDASGSRIVIVKLKAFQSNYEDVPDDGSFEINAD
jgi:hypothetical protein